MIRAALLAGASALLGGVIALSARRVPALLERTRTFAFAAAAGVVAFHLLPEVLPAQGLAALLWIGVGFALPWVLEAGARALGPRFLHGFGMSGLRVAAEVGFAALLFHSVVEGLALVAALAQPSGQLDLEIALVAHHAPLTAAVVLPFLELKGPRTVAQRALLVGAAGVAGALASAALPGFTHGAFLTTATAVTAGALLHVVADEIRAQRFGSPWERAADLAACSAGLLVAGLGAALHLKAGGHAEAVLEFLQSLGGVSLAVAPALLFGSIAGAILTTRKRSFRWDAFLLALVLLGPAAAGVLALVLALHRSAETPPAQSVREEFLRAARDRAPPLLALLLVAAGMEVSAQSIPTNWLAAAAVAAGVALAARLDEAGAVAVAAVLVGKGLHPGLAVALLAAGPLSRGLRDRRGLALLLAAASFALAAVLSAVGAFASTPAGVRQVLAAVHQPLAAQAAASPLGLASAVVLLAVALANLWSEGVRGWFAPLRHGPQTA